MDKLVQGRPRFSLQEATRLAAKRFGITGTAKMLPGERDQNMLLTTSSGERYVLKLSNAGEEDAFLCLQNEALLHLATHAPDLTLPRVLKTTDGSTLSHVTSEEGLQHGVRLLTFLPGQFLAQVQPHSPVLMMALGRFMGHLDRALAAFDHPGARRTFHWDMQHSLAVVREHRSALPSTSHEDLVMQFVDLYENVVEPRAQQLPKQIIHNDANDYNVLAFVRLDFAVRIVGLIDFGDMVYSYRVAEVVVAAAYAMLDKENPLEVAAQIVRGYHQEQPLDEVELEVLFAMIAMRLCMSVCIGSAQIAAQPENEYLAISQRPAWALLEKLRTVHPRFATYTLRHACGLEPCPQTPALRKWLVENASTIGPLLPTPLLDKRPNVLDLSVGSLAVASQQPSMEEASAHLFADLRRSGAQVGIGRYNEARRFYDSEHFMQTPDGVAEARTIHLGLDLFAEAGTSVLAPLAGTVVGIADNNLPLDYGPTVILKHEPTSDITFFTLYGHLSRQTLAHLKLGQSVAKGDVVGWLGMLSENGGWPPHLHLQLIVDLLDQATNFPGVAAPSQRDVWLSLAPNPNLLTQLEDGVAEESPSKERLLERRRQHLASNLSVSYKKPLHVVRGQGVYLFDSEGRAYIDGVNNVCHVGHCHPRVVEAGTRQLAVLNTNTRYLHENILCYAERLAATFPDPLSVCFFVNSGSEANELALRLARAHTRRDDFIILDAAYHGNTGAMVDLSPYKHDGPGGRGTPEHVHKALLPDGYRGRYRFDDPDMATTYAADVRRIAAALNDMGRGVAGFIAESLPGCGGQIVLPDGYLAAAYEHVRSAGGVCIADEVQVGFGRVGSHFWGFELQGVVPDIVTMGKPIGNGHPLGAVITTPEIAASFANGMEYFNTFGGNPVSCAIGLAVLDVIEQEGLQAQALNVGTYLMNGLRRLQEQYSLIGHVRGAGLYIGVELVVDPERRIPASAHATYIAERMRDQGMLISTDGPAHNVLKIKPPLAFNKTHADRLLEVLGRVLQETPLQLG